MAGRGTKRPWLTAALAVGLLVSAGLNVAHWLGGTGSTGPRILRLTQDGPARQPTLLVDFDAPMVPFERVGLPLPDGLVRVEPPTTVAARFVTERRLLVQVMRPLALFQEARMQLGPALADAAGRPLQGDATVAFTTGRLELARPAVARFDEAGQPIAVLAFNGPVAAQPLRDHLRLVDAGGDDVPFTLAGEDDAWELRLERLPRRGARIEVAAGLTSRLGPAGVASPIRADLEWPGTLRVVDAEVTGVHPRRHLLLTFSHVLAPGDASALVTVDPKPDHLEVAVQGATLRLSGAFPPRRVARVVVRQGLAAAAGMRLEEDVARALPVPAPDADVDVAQEGNTLSTAALPSIRIRGINVPVVEVTLEEVYPNNVVPLALRWERSSRLAAPAIVKRVPVDAPADEAWTRTLDLADLLGRPPRGVYHLTVRDPESYWGRSSRLLQVTDLAPVARVTPKGLVVLVARLSDGAPVAGARVEAFDAKNQPCASGTTDERGLLLVPQATGEPFVVTVTTADDRAWVDLRTHAVAHAPKDVEGRPTPQGLEAYVYADRGVVRPGEVAHVAALVRAPDGAAAPAALPLDLEVRAPDRRVVRRLRALTDAHGMAGADLPFALDAPTGPYVLTVAGPGADEPIGEVAFRVEAVVPDRIEPALVLPAGDLAPGTTVAVGLAARLLTGEAIGGLTARLRVRYAPVFEDGEAGYAWGDRFAATAPFTGPEVERRLDEAGTATVDVTVPGATASGAALQATFELEVVDVSGRAAFTRLVRRVVPQGPRLGVARPGDGPFEVPILLAGAERATVRATLQRVRTVGAWVLEGRRSVWRGEAFAEPVDEATVAIKNGRGLVTFPDPGDGSFRVVLEASGAAPAAVGFERWDGETFGAASPGAPRLAMRLAGGPVAPGATATLAVDTPVAGRALLTIETDAPLEARVVDLAAGPQRLEVPLPAVDVPNVHVTLTLVRGAREAQGRPARLLGAVAVPLVRPARRVDVALDLPGEVLPESRLEVAVRTSAPATVRVHLVDEGILRLTGHASPDPRAWLDATRRLDTRLADVYATLLEGMRFGGDDAESGGGADLAARLDPTARKTILTVALASALVTCDGEATVAFDLPAYEGRLRVFAVAAGTDGTGSAEAPLVVRGPLSVAVHVPRAVAPGDVFDVPVQVRGEGVAWDVALEGLERVEAGGTLRVRAGEAPGVAAITVTARDEAGHTLRRTARLSVRPAAPFTVVHEVHAVAAGERFEGRAPGTWLAGHATASVVVGGLPGLEALPALERLLEYPYGCIEQTTSRGFSVLACAELLRAVHPEGLAPEDVVGAAIDRVLSMQTGGGGLSFWPGGSTPYDFGSAYGAHFLVEARRAGRAVPAEPLDGLLDFLEGRLRRGRADAYTARVLALAGRDVAPFLDALAHDATTSEEQADLAAAYLLTGDAPRARALLGEAGDPWAAPREMGGRLSSPARAAATLLSALVDAAPEDPRIPDLVARLAAQAGAGAGTTQEDAAVLLALSKAYARRAQEAPSRGRVTVAGTEHAFSGDGLTLTFDPASAPAFALDADGATTLVLRVAGIPREPRSGTVERGMTVRRRIEAPPGALKQGHVYRVVLEGTLPPGAENVLVSDVLPGGLEIEAARDQEGTLLPDRVEPRDDRVLFFRTAPVADGTFRQTYLVRAVTVGTFAVPPVAAELLYAPAVHARSGGGSTLEIAR